VGTITAAYGTPLEFEKTAWIVLLCWFALQALDTPGRLASHGGPLVPLVALLGAFFWTLWWLASRT